MSKNKWQSAGMWVDQKCAIVQMPLVTHPVETHLWINVSVVFNLLMGSKVNPLNGFFFPKKIVLKLS